MVGAALLTVDADSIVDSQLQRTVNLVSVCHMWLNNHRHCPVLSAKKTTHLVLNNTGGGWGGIIGVSDILKSEQQMCLTKPIKARSNPALHVLIQAFGNRLKSH